MKINVTQKHIDTAEYLAVEMAILEALVPEYPEARVRVLRLGGHIITIKFKPEDDTTKVYPLEGQALQFENAKYAPEGLYEEFKKPFEFELGNLKKMPRRL